MAAWGQTNWIDKANTDWYDSPDENGWYHISTAEDLAGLAQLVNGGNEFSGKTIKLDADIRLNDTSDWESWETTPPENSWTPIGTLQNKFYGTFDGHGNTVSGIYISVDETNQGLFGYLNGGTIQNLIVEESYIKGSSYIGGIVGVAWSSTVSNCSNSGSVAAVEGTDDQLAIVGGIVGYGSNVEVSNCSNSGSVAVEGFNAIYAIVGGIIGHSSGSGSVSNCSNRGSVAGEGSGYVYVGGIVGSDSFGLASDEIKVMNCSNSGSVTGIGERSNYVCVGGVVGYNKLIQVSYCSNSGVVSGEGNVGGVMGLNSGIGTASNCYYLDGTCDKGIGVGSGTTEKVEMKTKAEYKSGDVLLLLDPKRETWGQDFNNGGYPVPLGSLSAEKQAAAKVYSATFTYMLPDAQEATIEIKYGNSGTQLTEPEVKMPDGYTFAWDKEPDKFGTEDLTFNGTFTEEPAIAYTLTINQPENGTISATADGKSINSGDNVVEGTTVTLTATTNSGYHFVKWDVVSGNISIEDNQFIMPAEDVTIQAVAHMLTKIEEKAATCTEDGNIEYWTCESCGKYFKDMYATEEITEEETIIKAGHQPITIREKEPTCTEDGYTGDKICSVCQTLLEEGTIIPANGHIYENGKCTVCGEKDPDYEPDPEPEPEPEPAYFTLDFDDHPCDGVTLNSNLTAVEEGGTLYLYVEKEDETLYDYDNMRIYAKRGANADWEELTEDPNRPGVYPIERIWTDIFIKVEGVEPIEPPTAIAGVQGVQVYAREGAILVHTPTEARVVVVAMNGTVKASGKQTGLRRYALPRGFYVVWVDGVSFKVAN